MLEWRSRRGPASTRIGRYIGDVVCEVADLDRRPIVEKPKPDPDGLCKQ